jgi:hypothetical protein
LRAHLPPEISEATLQQLSDGASATPTEVAAIYSTHPRVQGCRKTFLSGLAQSEPTLVPVLIASYNKGDDELLALIQRTMPWGDYVRRMRDRSAETRAQVQAADQRVVTELKQENAAELAQRQRAAEAMAAWAQTQQLINAANRPRITNCSGFGNMVNCVSQ